MSDQRVPPPSLFIPNERTARDFNQRPRAWCMLIINKVAAESTLRAEER